LSSASLEAETAMRLTHIGAPTVLIEAGGYPTHVPLASDR
jgi:hypothetical protein